MPLNNESYDFVCGNDARHLKVAIKNNCFHTITIEADQAKSINFSGGTKKVETIRLSKCFKMTRMIWPEHTGSIRRLFISHCDAIKHLDVSKLTQLDELSIVNCHSLEEITGLPASIKELNIHQTNVKRIIIPPDSKLQKINISTFSPELTINAESQPELQILYCEIKPNKKQKNNLLVINASNCKSLHMAYFDAGHGKAEINIENCGNLKELTVISDLDSTIDGLITCKNAKLSNEKPQRMSEVSKNFYGSAQRNTTTISDRETIVQQSGSKKGAEKETYIKITMLSSPEYVLEDVKEHELARFKRNIKVDDTFFLANIQSALFFLPQLPFSTKPAAALPNSRVLNKLNPSESIALWRSNKDKLTPNILLLRNDTIALPEVKKVIQEFHNKPNMVKQNNRFINHQIVIFGDRYYVANQLPYLASAIVTIPLSAVTTPPAVTEAVINSSHLASESRTIENISKLVDSQQKAKLFKSAARDFMNKLHTYISKNQPAISDWTPIDADKSHEDAPDLQGRNAKQTPIKHRDAPDSALIDASGNHEDIPDLQGRNAKQTPIKHQDVPEWTPIDADAENKEAPRLVPDEDRNQQLINKDIKISEEKIAPRLNQKPAHQQFLFHQHRKAIEDMPEQHLIDASAENQSDSDTALLVAARSFAKALKGLVDAIPSTKNPSTPEFKAATDYITHLNSESHHIFKDEPALYAANKLFNAMDLLDTASQQTSEELKDALTSKPLTPGD